MPDLRVAVVGSGPAGLYAAAELLRRDAAARVDLFERLPTPGGLVRAGVSPDHCARREIVSVYERLLHGSGRFRFFGSVEVGSTLGLEELRARYHAIVHASGATQDRCLGIPGEDAVGSDAANAFVGWYNGHPQFSDQRFALDSERAVVVGNGNVALDVARMLLLTPQALERSDVADHALTQLRLSRVREVVVLGRRGPAQAAFTAPELLELTALEDVDIHVEAPATELRERGTHPLRLRLLREYAERGARGCSRRLVLKFLAAPAEILTAQKRVTGLRVAHNELVAGADGSVQARATGREEVLPCGLVFRAVGYRAEPVAELPFDAASACVPNREGRVVNISSGAALRGHYVAGWLKRGPSGVIGSNKPCSQQTVAALLADAAAGTLREPTADADDLPALLAQRRVRVIDYHAWKRIDRHERSAGAALGRPRLRQVTLQALMQAAQ